MKEFLTVVPVFAVLGFLFFRVIEHGYIAFFNKPLYVHFYFLPKRLKRSQRIILRREFDFYGKLSKEEKKYFEYRVADFISEYEFVGKEGLVITEQMRILVAATSTMLTFGMKNYLYDVFDRIIIYPEAYFSTVNKVLHKGEFNPKLKVLVFSWKDFLIGNHTDADNYNLGLHEFAHALNFQAMKSNNTSMTIFSDMFREIMQYIHHPTNAKRLIESNYFRIYAYTNRFEFLAVVLEHFFESPQEFEKEFPELYQKVVLMLNSKSVK